MTKWRNEGRNAHYRTFSTVFTEKPHQQNHRNLDEVLKISAADGSPKKFIVLRETHL